MFEYGFVIVPSIIIGIITRMSMLRVDERQYPSYPQGVFSHIILGMIAASLGSVAIPALAENEFSAVTFLALAAQQFRDVRNLERQSLDNIEPTELVARGTAYIEDIAKAFEARNYVTMFNSLIVSLVIFVLDRTKEVSTTIAITIGMVVGLGCIIYFKKLISRQIIKDIADVIPAEITFNGPLLVVNGVVIMNVGLQASRDIYLKNGIAIEIIPKDANGVATLSNVGQRQAIQHNAAALLGIRKDVDEPDFTPLARRNPENGNVVVTIVPMNPDVEYLVGAVEKTIVVESAKRKPLETYIGRKSAH